MSRTPLQLPPSASPITWLLALCFLFVIDAAITRTSLLWGPTAFEHSGGVRTVFPQTYQVMRKIYAPEGDPRYRVAVLGNSRIAMALNENRLEQALREIAPQLDVAVSNLGVFGSFLADTQALARHLGSLEPELVVVALGGPDLIRESTNEEAARLLRIGLRDGPGGEVGFSERVDRWLRTVWPLYRFREFARAAILDRVLMRKDPGPPPDSFETRGELFEHLYAESADEVLSAYQAFESDRTLAAYARYLETTGAGHLARGKARAQSTEPLDRGTPSVAALDLLVADLVASGTPVVILLMPENPILAEDTRGEFHRPELSATAATLVKEIAARHGAVLVDGRGWLPVEAFLDFDHPILDLDPFDARFAAAIVGALQVGASQPGEEGARG